MMETELILWIGTGMAVGLALGWFFTRQAAGSQIAMLRQENNQRQQQLELTEQARDTAAAELAAVRTRLTESETTRKLEAEAAAEKLALIEDARNRLADAFKALASEALRHNNESFLKLATENLNRYQEGARDDLDKRNVAIARLVQPLGESLEKVNQRIAEIEQKRTEAYAGLREQVQGLLATGQGLQEQTRNLVMALRAPQVRGRWGEMQLRRAVEMAGMVNYCDFSEQQTVTDGDNRQRPDLVIHMPSGRDLVVDAKAPLAAYLDALETDDAAEKARHLERHARHIRDHLRGLGSKEYWKQFDPSPEFVILFLPGESFFSAALQADPGLLEFGIGQQTLIATPTTLIALLKAVAFGWRQEEIAKEAREIGRIGAELHDRVVTWSGHFDKLKSSLERSVDAYNNAVGSLEARVLPTARKLKELHAGGKNDIPALKAATPVIRKAQTDTTPQLDDSQ